MWQDLLIEKFRSLGYEPEPYKRGIEFWIRGDRKLDSNHTYVHIFRFAEDTVHVALISYSDKFGLHHHSTYALRQHFVDYKKTPVYDYDFSTYAFPPDPNCSDLSYAALEKKIIQNIEQNYRTPAIKPPRTCLKCLKAEVDCFWTTCDHE